MRSKFILGTVQFGLEYGINNSIGKPSKEKVFEILDYAKSCGIELLDTAKAYGTATNLIEDYNHNQARPFDIITKFHSDIHSNDLDESLKQFISNNGLDSIYACMFHSYNDYRTDCKSMTKLVSLKSEGFIKKIGVSVYSNQEIESIINDDQIDLIQLPFNLLDNYQQKGELLEKLREKGKIIHVRSIFLQGLFFKDPNDLSHKLQPLRPALIQIQKIAQEEGLTIEELAISYALSVSSIDNLVIGVDSLEQLKSNLTLEKSRIDQSIIDRINSITISDLSLLNPSNWN